MNIDYTCSLIISTYNNPAFLNLSLKSLFRQTILPGEVIIADDGSTNETYELISAHRKMFPIPLLHVWHPDNGFQVGKIRNIAVANAKYDYIIQVDGDIVMNKYFIADHLFHRQPSTLIQGSRIFVSPAKTKDMIQKEDVDLSFFSKGIKDRFKTLRSRSLSKFLSNKHLSKEPLYYTRGCNVAYHKKDFIQANGYNHDFTGWGHEDSEIALRMLNNGVKKNYIKFNSVAYHLYHPENSHDRELKNREMMHQNALLNLKTCPNGVNEFLDNYEQYLKK